MSDHQPHPPVPDSETSTVPTVEVRFGDCRFDPASGLLWRAGEEIALAPRPLDLLRVFLSAPGRVLGRAELLERIWDEEFVEEDALTQAVSVLRAALGDDRRRARYIQTLHGRGYRFVAEVEPVVPRPGVAPEARSGRSTVGRVVVAAGVLLAVALGAWFVVDEREAAPAPDPPLRYKLPLPEGVRPAEFTPGAVAISSDGTVALVAYADHTTVLLSKAADEYGLRVLEGTQNAHAPFFSPDGAELAYFDEQAGALAARELATGATRTIVAVTDPPHRGVWTADGSIYFTAGRGGLLRVSAGGGPAERVATPSEQRNETRFLDVAVGAPGTLMLTVGTRDMISWNEARVLELDLASGAVREMLAGGLAPRRLGRSLWFARAGSLQAARIDDDGTVLAAQTALDDISTFGLTGAAAYAISEAGVAAFLPGGERDVRTGVSIVGRDGERLRLDLRPGTYVGADADAGGTRVALWTGGELGHVWTYDLTRGTLTRQTHEWQNMAPLWHPDGHRLVYTSFRGGRYELRLKEVDDAGPGEVLLESGDRLLAGSWTPDGRRLAYGSTHDTGGSDLHLLDVTTSTALPLVATRFDERSPAISPDGRWFAYVSDETGERQVYVALLERPASRRQVSVRAAGSVHWNAAGTHIVYALEDRVLAVPFAAGPDDTIRLGAPETVLDSPILPRFDTLPDGRLLVIEELPMAPSASELSMVHGLIADRR